MSKIFIPSKGPEDWKALLRDPEKQWKTGYSAKALAYCWEEADGDFPEPVKTVFASTGIELFQDIELLLAIPEYKVSLPGGRASSQNDIFILGKGNHQLVSIMVEGKVSEDFDKTVDEWKKKDMGGRQERLEFLCKTLQLEEDRIGDIHYQLIHRTASAIMKAEKFNAENALMLVHSFSQSDEHLDDYGQFLSLFDLNGKVDSIAGPRNVSGIDLYFGWVRGDQKYLSY